MSITRVQCGINSTLLRSRHSMRLSSFYSSSFVLLLEERGRTTLSRSYTHDIYSAVYLIPKYEYEVSILPQTLYFSKAYIFVTIFNAFHLFMASYEHGSRFLPSVAIQRLSLPGPSYRNAVIPPVAVRDLLTSPKFITTLFALGTEQKVYLTINTTVEPHMDGHARYIEQDLGLRSKSLR